MSKGAVSAAMDMLQEQLRGIAEFERQRTALTSTATALDGAVEVTVNCDGQLTGTYFADDISWISPADLAAAVTAAAKAAAVDVARRTEELRAPLMSAGEQLPTVSDLVLGLPDFDMELPVPPRPRAFIEAESDQAAAVPTELTRRSSEVLADPDESSPAIELSDAEPYEEAAADRGSEVADSGWG